MKITQKAGDIQHFRRLVLAFDVSKDKLDCYGEYGSGTVEDSLANRTEVIEQKLLTLSGLAQSAGFEGLHVLAEPTGIYHRKLLRTARRLGHTTALVNVESVSKLKVVESNDTGKTDEKDPRVILMLWKLGKTLTDRVIRGEYLLLREYNRIYDVEEKELVRVRNRIHECLMELYCDYSFKKDFLYGKSGRVLMDLYSCSPYRIVRSGWVRFRRRMRRVVPGIREETLRRLWDDASTSVLHRMDGDYVAVLQVRMRQLWAEYLLRKNRLEGLREEIVRLVGCLRERDSRIPQATRGVITEFWIGRLLGETGPLGDFSDIRKLYRYAGLNIRERRSGTYVGQNRISKKGRSSLRKVLGQIVFPLVRRRNLYGEYYHTKRDHGMSGSKAMVAVQRKFLKMFYGWYKSESLFDIERVFNSCTVSIYAL